MRFVIPCELPRRVYAAARTVELVFIRDNAQQRRYELLPGASLGESDVLRAGGSPRRRSTAGASRLVRGAPRG